MAAKTCKKKKNHEAVRGPRPKEVMSGDVRVRGAEKGNPHFGK